MELVEDETLTIARRANAAIKLVEGGRGFSNFLENPSDSPALKVFELPELADRYDSPFLNWSNYFDSSSELPISERIAEVGAGKRLLLSLIFEEGEEAKVEEAVKMVPSHLRYNTDKPLNYRNSPLPYLNVYVPGPIDSHLNIKEILAYFKSLGFVLSPSQEDLFIAMCSAELEFLLSYEAYPKYDYNFKTPVGRHEYVLHDLLRGMPLEVIFYHTGHYDSRSSHQSF